MYKLKKLKMARRKQLHMNQKHLLQNILMNLSFWMKMHLYPLSKSSLYNNQIQMSLKLNKQYNKIKKQQILM